MAHYGSWFLTLLSINCEHSKEIIREVKGCNWVDFHCRIIFMCVYTHVNFTRVYKIVASHAGVFRGARFSSLPRDEKRAPLKTPAWEANKIEAR